MSSLVLLLALAACLDSLNHGIILKKARKAPRAVKAGDESNSNSLEGSTEEDAVHVESKLLTRDVYHGPTVCQPIPKVARRVSRAGLGAVAVHVLVQKEV